MLGLLLMKIRAPLRQGSPAARANLCRSSPLVSAGVGFSAAAKEEASFRGTRVAQTIDTEKELVSRSLCSITGYLVGAEGLEPSTSCV